MEVENIARSVGIDSVRTRKRHLSERLFKLGEISGPSHSPALRHRATFRFNGAHGKGLRGSVSLKSQAKHRAMVSPAEGNGQRLQAG